jgi:uncharacterized protein with von Willebrand factor type A (vWA) domain
MDELAKSLMQDGNLPYALWKMQRQGFRGQNGRLPGLQELLQKLRQAKQRQLDKYNLSSIMDDIRQKLDNILKTEREGIQKKVDEARQKAEKGAPDVSPEIGKKLQKRIEDMAAKNREKLDKLPLDVGGRIKELLDYDFMDEQARQQFQELMEMLKQHAMEQYSRDLTQQIKNMDPQMLANMRHLVEAINQMLEQRLRGEEPDFDKFMEEFGDYFGPNPPQNLDELIERMQQQISQAQSLLESMSEGDRKELEKLLQGMIDEATQYELAKMAANMEALHPTERNRRNYPFSGEESISYTEALKLMEKLQQMDKLEGEIKDAQFTRNLDTIDDQSVKELLGEEAATELERIREMTKVLEEAGYIRRAGKGYELTPLGMRKIGQKALRDVFAQLQKDRLGGHKIDDKGALGERALETKQYEFGDNLDLDLKQTIMNALLREPQTPPVRLSPKDFEVYESEQLTRSATVLMLDLSLSMPMRGNFYAAKQVAMALDSLIRSQFPRDSLHIIGFSSYAREIKKDDLPTMGWDEFDPYTNIQHGLALARKLLAKERSQNKQVILVSDGEPTAHVENGQIYFQYPPSVRTIQLTLKEVEYCTKAGVIINTFMLGESYFLNAFVTRIAQVNKGRVFFTTADSLGQYMLVDYINNKKKGLR